MATMVKSEKDIVSLLNDLISLDYDAIEAYEAAIVRLSDPSDKDHLQKFLGDHVRHTIELAEHVAKYGYQPATKADIKRVLTKGKVVLAGLAGETAVLGAMKSNEDDTNTAYERAVSQQGIPEIVRAVLTRNLSDERRHRAWLEHRLQSFQSTEPSARI